MDLSTLGEREIISAMVSSILSAQDGMGGDRLGMEDDCASIPWGEGALLVSTDTMNARTHFPAGTPMDLAGWYAAAVNLSDLAAMGADPVGLLMAYGFPLAMNGDDISELVGGVMRCAGEYGAPILGGDTKQHDLLTITGTALGRIERGEPMTRRAPEGVAEGDAVVVTGSLGNAAAGCVVTRRLLDAGEQLKRRGRYIEALGHVLNVRPRLAEGRALREDEAVVCAMDLSDGLARSLHTLGRVNRCGFSIDASRLPAGEFAARTGEEEGLGLEDLCLYFGGDFELVAVVGGGKEGVARAGSAVGSAGGTLTVIGEAAPEGHFTLAGSGGRGELEDRGWEHFFAQPSLR